jgi:hypothetical protein
LYERETWSLTISGDHRLRVFEKSVLRIFGYKWEEVVVKWRRLLSEEFNKFKASPNIIRVLKSRRMR